MHVFKWDSPVVLNQRANISNAHIWKVNRDKRKKEQLLYQFFFYIIIFYIILFDSKQVLPMPNSNLYGYIFVIY